MPSRPDYSFASDNTAGICPEAWAALGAANVGRAPSYGSDDWTARAKQRMQDIFETACDTFFVFNGTASNALTFAALCRRYESVICHDSSHADVDECGAPEFFTGGSKLIALAGPNGKLTPAVVEPALHRGHGVHYPKPGALALTQSTERGTVYSPDETRALAALAHHHGMRVQLDGARFANAAAALQSKGVSPADLTWRAGVDVLCFGGTKNGMLSTEAIVFFNRDLAREFEYHVKQGGQLASKMRFASAQWEAMLADGAWLRHAHHANLQARRLAEALSLVQGVKLMFEPEVNGIFVELAPAVFTTLEARGWIFHRFIGANGYRLMTSWATTDAELTAFLTDLRAVVR